MKSDPARASRLLVTMPWSISDAIDIGLSAVDQITRNDPDGEVAIDILCNFLQAPLFEYDPRIHTVITFNARLFSTATRGTWMRGLFLSPEARKLASYLRQQEYAGTLPLFFGPSFLYLLHTHMILPNTRESWKTLRAWYAWQNVSMQTMVRRLINKHFGGKAPSPVFDELIPLYLCPDHLKKARQYLAQRSGQTGRARDQIAWLLVAPDTSSVVTRPSTTLLAEGIAGALQGNTRLCVEILPGYTDTQAANRLWHALAPRFPERVFLMPSEPRMSLPGLASLIDQSDLFLSGDTGAMHLAAAVKTLPRGICTEIWPRNTVKIIALFGGTHPTFRGYRKRTIILGQGRKEQSALVPGILKGPYRATSRDFFDHISPSQLTKALLE